MPIYRPPLAAKRSGVAASLSRAALAVCLFGGQARADDLTDVQGLSRDGQTAAALARADRALAAQPDQPQLQFLKGVLLADAKRNDEAAAVFLKLTQDHPDLVEPYNNLAALHAANGDYAKARAALELALRAAPGYATAHENLGDVYAAMAAQAYARAQQLAPGNSAVAPKLALLRQLLAPKTGATARSTPSNP